MHLQVSRGGRCRRLKGERRDKGSPRGSSGTPKAAKPPRITNRVPLPSWLGNKPENADEWFYTDPKVSAAPP